MTTKPTLAAVRRSLLAARNPTDAAFLQRFFRTGPGQYGEGDRFLGLRVPATRQMAAEFRDLSLPDVETLLHDRWHEARLLALILLVDAYQRGTAAERTAIYRIYLRNTARVNNWDLVDASAAGIVGEHLLRRARAPLYKLARSKSLWERRIAIIATFAFIREGEFDDALKIGEALLRDEHDLIHKAVGWMLREIGKRDVAALTAFLDAHAAIMPRTMLRYAIERLPSRAKKRYMAAGKKTGAR